MKKLEILYNELSKIKDDIYNEESTTQIEVVFKKLINLNELESDLYETLILLYANIKAEFDIVKSSHLKHSTKIIDTSIQMVNEVNTLITEVEQVKENLIKIESNKKKSIFTIKNIGILLSIFIFLFIILIATYHFLPEESTRVFEFITNMSNSKLAN